MLFETRPDWKLEPWPGTSSSPTSSAAFVPWKKGPSTCRQLSSVTGTYSPLSLMRRRSGGGRDGLAGHAGELPELLGRVDAVAGDGPAVRVAGQLLDDDAAARTGRADGADVAQETAQPLRVARPGERHRRVLQAVHVQRPDRSVAVRDLERRAHHADGVDEVGPSARQPVGHHAAVREADDGDPCSTPGL